MFSLPRAASMSSYDHDASFIVSIDIYLKLSRQGLYLFIWIKNMLFISIFYKIAYINRKAKFADSQANVYGFFNYFCV